MWSSMVYWYNTLLYFLIFTPHNLILLSCYLCVFFCVLLKKLRFNKYIFWAALTQHNILYALLYCRHVQNHFIFCYQKLSRLPNYSLRIMSWVKRTFSTNSLICSIVMSSHLQFTFTLSIFYLLLNSLFNYNREYLFVFGMVFWHHFHCLN